MKNALIVLAIIPLMAFQGHVGANVVSPATMRDDGTLSPESPQPTQQRTVINPDGSTTFWVDY